MNNLKRGDMVQVNASSSVDEWHGKIGRVTGSTGGTDGILPLVTVKFDHDGKTRSLYPSSLDMVPMPEAPMQEEMDNGKAEKTTSQG